MGDERAKRTAVRIACVGIGLLFLARGATLPYFYPLFEHVTALSYGEIAALLTMYAFWQAAGAPAAGWYTDRTSIRFAVCTAIGLGGLAFLTLSRFPGFVPCALAMSFAGFALVLAKIALNTLLVDNCSIETLRRTIATRAALLNIGSFAGNLLAFYTIRWLGYPQLLFLLAGLNLTLAVVFFAPAAPRTVQPASHTLSRFASAFRQKGFLADSLRLLSIYLPYGCWGTIIPKYVIDIYSSNDPIRLVYFTSLITILLGSYLVNGFLAGKLHDRGFRWNWWVGLAQVFYCAGLVSLTFAANPVILVGAVAIFICGEIVMTPCLPEVARRHAPPNETGTYLGILHLFEGSGRCLGSAFAFFLYAEFKDSANVGFFWVVLTILFLIFFAALQALAHRLDRPTTLRVSSSGLAESYGRKECSSAIDD
jgi:MFS family permease